MKLNKILIHFISILLFSLIILGNQSCKKGKYKNPTCDSNCITIHAIFFDATNSSPFSNQKMTVKAARSTGVGMSFTKLWDMKTNDNGEAIFDVSYNDINTHGNISFFLCSKRYSEKNSTTGNRVDLFVDDSDIGKTVTKEFLLYIK